MPADQGLPVGRRKTDVSVLGPESLQLLILFREELSESRHALRNEITLLAARVENQTLIASREHSEVKGEVVALRAGLEQVLPLVSAVTELQTDDRVDHVREATAERVRQAIWRAALSLAGLIVAAVAAVAALAH